MFRLLASAALLAAVQASPVSTQPYTCHDYEIEIPVNNVTTLVPSFAPIQDADEATYYANLITERDGVMAPPQMTTLTKTFTITGKWCAPTKTNANSTTLQILTHGLGFDQSYWDFYAPNSTDPEYSYVNAATSAGYTTLLWNRLGIKPSTLGDPYTEVQAGVQQDILITLTQYARDGKIPGLSKPSKVIHVGHSFGSELTLALAAAAPELSDGVVITGLSGVATYAAYFVSATSFHIANQNQPSRFSMQEYPNGYLTWGSKQENQYSFLAYPNFDPAVLVAAEATKAPFTLGEFTTMTALPQAAPAFKNPVLYLASQHDLIACGFNCEGLFGEGSAAYNAFNGSMSIESYIQPGAGHALNIHKNATGAYAYINNWLERHF